MRIMTGRPVFFAMCAGMDMMGYPPPFDPNPPPQFSATNTRFSGSMPTYLATPGTALLWL